MRRTIAQVIYFDNAATAWPKAPGVAEAMAQCVLDMGGSMGRGTYAAATENAMAALSVREALCALTGTADAACCIFTSGATWALNQAILGFVRPGDHVLTSSLEHNAVLRPLALIGAAAQAVPCDGLGRADPGDVARRIRPDTRLVVMSHASNVWGCVLPAREIAQICAARGVPFLLDASQTAGHLALSDIPASAFALPGHKGFLGPEGIGALVVRRDFAARLRPIVAGGTGSLSESLEMPDFLPDRFEPGTANIPGIYGLRAALSFLTPRRAAVYEHDMALLKRFLAGLSQIRGIRVPGGFHAEGKVAVASISFETIDNAAAAHALAERYAIMTRCALHCAPAAHRALQSYPAGAVRFSFGWANTPESVDLALRAVEEIARAR